MTTKFPNSIATADDFRFDRADIHDEFEALLQAVGPNLGNLVKFDRTTLTAAQVKATKTGTVEFLAGFNGLLLVPVAQAARFKAKTTPYGAYCQQSVLFQVGYTADYAASIVGFFSLAGLIDQTSNRLIPATLIGGLGRLIGLSAAPLESNLIGSGLSLGSSNLPQNTLSGKIVTANKDNAGTGYQAGDVLTIASISATIVVDTVSGGTVSTYHFSNPGIGASVGANYPVTGGHGINFSISPLTIETWDETLGDGELELITAYFLLSLD